MEKYKSILKQHTHTNTSVVISPLFCLGELRPKFQYPVYVDVTTAAMRSRYDVGVARKVVSTSLWVPALFGVQK